MPLKRQHPMSRRRQRLSRRLSWYRQVCSGDTSYGAQKDLDGTQRRSKTTDWFCRHCSGTVITAVFSPGSSQYAPNVCNEQGCTVYNRTPACRRSRTPLTRRLNDLLVIRIHICAGMKTEQELCSRCSRSWRRRRSTWEDSTSDAKR